MTRKLQNVRIVSSVILSLLITSVNYVVPASAAITNNQHNDISVSTASKTIKLGAVETGTVGFQISPSAISYAAGTYDSTTVTVSLSKPTGSALTASDVSLSQTSALVTSGHYSQGARSTNTWQFVQASTTTAWDTQTVATIGITPDVIGTYAITFTDGKSDTTTYTLTVVDSDSSLHSFAFAAGGTTASASIATAESATVSVKTTFVAAVANDSVTVKAILVDAPAGALGTTIKLAASDSSTSSGLAVWSVNPAQVGGSTGLVIGNATNAATTNATVNVTLYNPSVAGTYVVRIVDYYGNAGGTASSSWSPAITPLTFTVTVTAPSKTAGANSTAYIRSAEATYAAGTALTDSSVVASKTALTTDTTAEATIYVFQRNATSTADESMTVTVDGPAYVSGTTGTRPTSGTAVTIRNVGGNAPAAGSPIYVWATGTAGKATITVKSISGQLIGTKSVVFYGAVTTLANATDPKPMTIVRSGGKTLSSAWDISATDAAGQARPGLTLSCLSSNTLVIASCAFTDNGDGSYSMDLTSASGSTSGQTATITARVVDPAVTTSTAYITAPAVTVTTGSSVNTVTITTDKSSYTAGEQMVITVTAKDSSGNPVYDGAALAALSSNKSVTGLSNVATSFTGGVADSVSRDTDGSVLTTYRVFAPSSGGEVNIYLDYVNAALATVRATVTATVDDGSGAAVDAANEATDAANAATDAANAAAEAADAATAAAQDAQAAVAELATSVASLIAGIKAQITSLTNLMIKIQKKVKA